ncbi:MAG: hypothetical protein ACRDHX_08820 [Chloroflexota bacterium]
MMMTIGPGLAPPPPPNWSFAQLNTVRQQLATNGSSLAIPYKTSAGPGGQAVWMLTPQSDQGQARNFSAHGYAATRLAPTQFANSYRGGLLAGSFGLLRVDYKA